MIVVNKFLIACEKQQLFMVQAKHDKKLISLGLNVNNLLEHEINVVFNLSKYALNSVERSALNHGLQYSILPPYFDFLQTQTSFEKLYQESRPYLNHQDKIELKRILFSLYSKYKSGIFLLSVNILGPVMLQPNSCSVFLERSPLMMFGMD